MDDAPHALGDVNNNVDAGRIQYRIEYMSGLKLSDETDLMGKKHEANPVSALQF